MYEMLSPDTVQCYEPGLAIQTLCSVSQWVKRWREGQGGNETAKSPDEKFAESSSMVSSKSTLTLRVHDHNATLSPHLPPALKAEALSFHSFDDGPGSSSWHASTVAIGHGRVTCSAKLTLGKSRRECLLVPERSRYPPTWHLSLIPCL